MQKPRTLLLLGIGLVLAFDAVASVGALTFGFPYADASVGSFLIDLSLGFWAARNNSRLFSLLLGFCTGAADATVGWGISWALGPGRLPAGTFTATQLALAAASTVGVAVVLAGVGGLLGGFFRRRPA